MGNLVEELIQPLFAVVLAGQFDHDVIGVQTRVVGVARQPLLACRAGGQQLDVAVSRAATAGELLNTEL